MDMKIIVFIIMFLLCLGGILFVAGCASGIEEEPIKMKLIPIPSEPSIEQQKEIYEKEHPDIKWV